MYKIHWYLYNNWIFLKLIIVIQYNDIILYFVKEILKLNNN